VYRSEESIAEQFLPDRFKGERCFSTSIYFLLESNQFSKFHRIKSDEIWHHYTGDAVDIHVIDEDGKYSVLKLGKDIENGEMPMAVIPMNAWFGAQFTYENSFVLTGCTVSPGFDFADFEMADREYLLVLFPQYKNIIEILT